jgi:hypothetical protein
MNRTYHPKSWSEQARKKANGLFGYVMDMMYRNKELGFFDNMGEYHENVIPEQYVAHALSISYRPEIIRYRAAKRFGRMWRKHLAK